MASKEQNPKTRFSFEVLPPLKGTGTESLFRTIDTLKEFNPLHINITTHRSEYVYDEQEDGSFTRKRLRRRPGTIAVASAIMNKYDIKVVPHVVCSGFTKEDTEYMLLDLQFLGIHEVLALRGDKAKDESRFQAVRGGHSHTTDLLRQINAFNAGTFVDGTPIKHVGEPFTFGVACYPEKHEESPNPDSDLRYLKKKQDLGAKYAICQMFFDNQKYFSFVERARKAGVTIPIIPALKPMAKMSQITQVPKTFHLDIPKELADEAARCKTDEDVKQLGIEWSISQCEELIAHGVPCIHFYTMSAVDSIRQIAERFW
ncbi:MAG: methylenetetrahydrofolate reductase [Bacteroidaceae bacterium]|nr:methylenetetrahydrofolate reductase [NAD(P)H] [Bacteroidaceae bacterium]